MSKNTRSTNDASALDRQVDTLRAGLAKHASADAPALAARLGENQAALGVAELAFGEAKRAREHAESEHAANLELDRRVRETVSAHVRKLGSSLAPDAADFRAEAVAALRAQDARADELIKAVLEIDLLCGATIDARDQSWKDYGLAEGKMGDAHAALWAAVNEAESLLGVESSKKSRSDG